MKLINLPYFIELGAAFDRAGRVDPNEQLLDALFLFYSLDKAIREIDIEGHIKLSAASHSIEELRLQISNFQKRNFRDQDGNWTNVDSEKRDEYGVRSILKKIEEVRAIILAELRVSSAFCVTSSGIFDVGLLINSAHKALGAFAISRLDPDILNEIDDSGKCLAFNLPTASGFHAMRAVERVIKKYLRIFFQEGEIEKMNNWGHYVGALERRLNSGEGVSPSLEAVTLLRQIKDIYRNSIIHPDRVLNKDEASSIFHHTIAAINKISDEIPPDRDFLLKSARKILEMEAAREPEKNAANEAA
ncbi:hypothetical protein [Sphingosinicella sp.]|uniref:hypothetical protein n=1 Tax=Sphingosinicella sp. TaxID=1917971 RepID=UPI0035B474CA